MSVQTTSGATADTTRESWDLLLAPLSQRNDTNRVAEEWAAVLPAWQGGEENSIRPAPERREIDRGDLSAHPSYRWSVQRSKAGEGNSHTMRGIVKRRMRRLKVSQQSLASITGISQSVISKWLRGCYTGNNANVDVLMESWALDQCVDWDLQLYRSVRNSRLRSMCSKTGFRKATENTANGDLMQQLAAFE